MVTIEKGSKKKVIAISAFHNYYENAGWRISNDAEPLADAVEETVEETAEETAEEEDWDSVMEVKPLSEMNKQELSEKALELGIDISDLTTNKQIRERLKDYL